MPKSVQSRTSLFNNFATNIILLLVLIGISFKLTNCFTASSSSSPRHRHDSSDYLDILASNTPLLDVRAPIEFVKGSFPNTHNIPLLNDEQRKLIGTCYKEKGEEAAIALGQTLVNDDNDGKNTDTDTDANANANPFSNKSELVQSWKDHIERYPHGYLYCFRGGLRSHVAQQWLQEAGVDHPLIIGGYKAMRTSLLLDLEVSLQSLPIILVSGRTCSGKTIALKQLERYVDLEGLANHRGSAFGGIANGDQPAQIDFENSIIIEFRKHRHDGNGNGHGHDRQSESQSSLPLLPVFMEDEGRLIGIRTLPIPMLRPMADDFPLVILETPLEERVNICIEEYVTNPYFKFVGEYDSNYNDNISGNDNDNNEGIGTLKGEDHAHAHARIRNKSLGAVARLQKRLRPGILEEFENAFDLFESSHASNTDGFREPVRSLLEDYYDPMYDYQMGKRQGEILFRGNMEELVQWAVDYSPKSELSFK